MDINLTKLFQFISASLLKKPPGFVLILNASMLQFMLVLIITIIIITNTIFIWRPSWSSAIQGAHSRM